MNDASNPERIPLDVDLPIGCDREEPSRFEVGELGYCLVTGGAGYSGRNLAFELIRRGASVRIFDRREIDFSHERLDYVAGDIRQFEDVRKACEGVDTVFHTAALVDSLDYASRAQRDRSFAINVGGVANVLRACREAGVKRLIHTSVSDVTFGGEVVDGDESFPYAARPKDLLTETRILGEKAVLAGNGRGGLLTCAIRPGGIYGPGDQRVLARIVEKCAAGRLPVTLGDGEAKAEYTYIDNLVDGQIEAARHLLPGSPLGGQAYFITDGAPTNCFEFSRPFVEGMGFRYPRWRLSARLSYAVASVWEFLHWAVKAPRPMFTRLEVRGMTVSHYNRIDKARRDFGWTPPVSVEEANRRSLAYCRQLLAARERVERPHWAVWIAMLSGIGLLGVLALSPGAHALWSRFVTTWTPRWLLQGVFVGGLLVHVRNSMKAVRMAERADLHNTSMGWGWQTLALGFPSLWNLEKRIARSRSDFAGEAAGGGIRRWHWSLPFPNVRWLLVAITVLHRWLYLSTDGRVGHWLGRKRFLLLTHAGRRTGHEYVVPLLYVEDGGRFIVVASNGGDESDPHWLLNLQSRPQVEIQVGRERFPVEARRAGPEECRQLWPQLIEAYRSYTRYRRRTRREIPIVVLERAV